jgi:hypothetical protein
MYGNERNKDKLRGIVKEERNVGIHDKYNHLLTVVFCSFLLLFSPFFSSFSSLLLSVDLLLPSLLAFQ